MDANPTEDSSAIKERKNATLKNNDNVSISSNLHVQLIPKN